MPSGSVDAVVTSLVLCSVTDQAAVLAEVRRVLRPGGQLRFVEHVRARSRGLAWSQRVLDATVWPVVGAGCHTGRDTVAAVARAGLDIVDLDRFRMPDTRVPLPPAPHVRGTAVRPHASRPSGPVALLGCSVRRRAPPAAGPTRTRRRARPARRRRRTGRRRAGACPRA